MLYIQPIHCAELESISMALYWRMQHSGVQCLVLWHQCLPVPPQFFAQMHPKTGPLLPGQWLPSDAIIFLAAVSDALRHSGQVYASVSFLFPGSS